MDHKEMTISSPVESAPASRARQVYLALKQEILDWELPPGTPLSENELARRLGSSRTPVREAIQRLTREGLIRTVRGKGSFVTEISLGDVVELFEMREALEVGAACLAARSPARSSLNDLVPRFHDAKSSIDSSKNAGYYELIGQFDAEILRLCGNRRLAAALEEVWAQVRRVRHMAASDAARLLETVDEHLSIIEAVTQGDEALVTERVRAHMRASAENVTKSLTGRSGQRYVTL